ncbi:hypothetical protein BJ970_006561 [Saccharopolyspora phatthalungensis]|uniref:Uncharacterized protein n=1 Tax=Saccharopolyspora phatthalungensis TaxID=664693 RepID=A0A840Q8V1_9PSEU|nr:hypothetical protein [Saccharopolyspora phatthalungensis]
MRSPAGGEWLLIDWDGTCIGPRGLDLLTGIPNHSHESEAGRSRFLTAYGYTAVPGLSTFSGMTGKTMNDQPQHLNCLLRHEQDHRVGAMPMR